MRPTPGFSYQRLTRFLRRPTPVNAPVEPQLNSSVSPPDEIRGLAKPFRRNKDNGHGRIQTRPSIALNQLFEVLSDLSVTGLHEIHILDLGPARQNILELAARLPYRLHVADVVAGANLRRTEQTDSPRASLAPGQWRDSLPARPNDGFVAILCWDIFNYMNIEDIRRLTACLGALCKPGARMHGITYTGKTMPSEPLNFELLTPATLYRRVNISQSAPAPCYGAGVLADSMDGFRIEHLHQHGTDAVEALYVYQPR